MKRIFSILFGLALVLSFSLVATTPVAAATPIYVDASRPDDSGGGTSWATAKKYIQSGINIVDAGGTVNVAAGTYNESVVINKHLTLNGAGDTTIIQAAASLPLAPGHYYGIEIMEEGSGPSASDHTIISNLRVTGWYNGVQFHLYSASHTISHVTLQNVTGDHNRASTGYYGDGGNAVHFDKYTHYSDILIDHLTATDNEGMGIFSQSDVASFIGLTVTGGHFVRNVYPGIEITTRLVDDIIISGASFEGNGAGPAGSNGVGFDVQGDIVLDVDVEGVFSGENGDITITNVTIDSNNASAGIRITGGADLFCDPCVGGNRKPAGNITLTNVTINGTQKQLSRTDGIAPWPSAAIVLSRFSDVSKVHFTNVNLNSSAPTGLYLGSIQNTPAPTLDLDGGIKFNGTYPALINATGSAFADYSVSNVIVDAKNIWWGHNSGPYHPTLNPGGTGAVSDNVNFDSWIWKIATFTGTGTASFTPSAGNITGLTAVAEGSLPAAAQATKPINFPDGLFSFNITGLSNGQTVTVTITLPPGAAPTQYWKYHASEGGWVQIPMTIVGPPNVIRITLQDGGLGDDDGAANGVIVDQGGSGNPGAVGWETYPISKVRVLLPWIALLAAIVAGASLLVLRRRRVQS
jgi:hypothetical protein